MNVAVAVIMIVAVGVKGIVVREEIATAIAIVKKMQIKI
jgi:hypothetical protein